MRKYINGYDAPKFLIWNPVPASYNTITFKIRYQRLTEYTQEKYLKYDIIDDSRKNVFKNCIYFWDFDYSDLLEADELQKWNTVLNAFQLDYPVILYPHKDVNRSFLVVNDTDEKYTLDQHYGGIDCFGNKGMIFKMRSKQSFSIPGNSILWFYISSTPEIPDNPSDGIITVNELLSESGEFLLTEDNFPIYVE